MRRSLALFAALWLGCGREEPTPQPRLPKDLLPRSEHKFNEQTSCRYRFSTAIGPVRCEGVAVYVKPETLHVMYRDFMGFERWVMRDAQVIMLWNHGQDEWVSAPQCGDAVSGNGFQNLPQVLHALSVLTVGKPLDVHEEGGKKVARIETSDNTVRPLLLPELEQGRERWVSFVARITVALDANELPSRVDLSGELRDASGRAVKAASYIVVEEYNKDRELRFPVKQ